MASVKEKITSFVTKIKSVKHIEIIIAVVAVALMILIFSGVWDKKTSSKSNNQQTDAAETVIAESSISSCEKKLSSILSQIDGVGKTDVMITAKTSDEKVTAKTTTTNLSTSQNTSGNMTNSTNTTESPVIVNNNGTSEPYVVKEIMPEIIGVIVVAEGADDPVTKLAIMRAVQTLLNVSAACVEIYPMK